MVENCGTSLVLRSSASENGGTSPFASHLMGERQIQRVVTSSSRTHSGFLKSSTTTGGTSEQHATEFAVMPAEIEQLPDRSGFLKFRRRRPGCARASRISIPRRLPSPFGLGQRAECQTMKFWSSMKSPRSPQVVPTDTGEWASTSPYIAEYITAIDRTEQFGFEAPPRVLVRKPCVDLQAVLPMLLDYHDQHSPRELMGQTLAMHFDSVPRLHDKTGIHFNLTIEWMMCQVKPIHPHDENLVRRFVAEGRNAWIREGCVFHLWMTSLGCEILDITFAMNLGCPHTREQCARRTVYQSAYEPAEELVYHPTLVGLDCFRKSGAGL
jgi:hypothetical protein